MSIPPAVKYIALSILLTVATINFTRTIFDILESSKRLTNTKAEVLSLETKRIELENELERKKTAEFIEEKARNELNLKKPGEDVFIAPKGLGKEDDVASEKIKKKGGKAGGGSVESNVEAWVDLFF